MATDFDALIVEGSILKCTTVAYYRIRMVSSISPDLGILMAFGKVQP